MKIEDFSDCKKEIIKKDGVFVVKACAGSGKTSIVAAKIAFLLENWETSNRGIAAISFTNVAWQEIEYKLKNDFEITSGLDYPHFIGTIDSFINRYLFLPFGHLILKCETRPEIITDWSPRIFSKNAECISSACKLNEISYDIKGNLICNNQRSHFAKCSLDHFHCKNTKSKMCEKGFVTQTDTNYFAMTLLEKYPEIAKSIAFRFPLFLIDEAQDTSETQMRIFEMLLENGLNRLMIIGDPNQAIYEWRTANPDVFYNKEKKLKTLLLNENWRSSKKICAFTDKLVSEDYTSTPLNEEVKDYYFEPEIWGYNISEPLNVETNRLIKRFLETCEANKVIIDRERVAVLVRSNDILNEVKNFGNFAQKDPWREQKKKSHYTIHCRNIAKSKYLFDNKEYNESFKLFERTIYSIIKEKAYVSSDELKKFIDENGFKKWRIEIFDILTRLPKTDLKLKEWVDAANDIIKSDSFFNIHNFEMKIKEKGDYPYSEMKFEQMFREQKIDSNDYTLGTVHSVKGKTFEAVLLILKDKNYRNILYNDIKNDEEKRIIYVATTRPQKILVIAVPVKDKELWENKFFNRKSPKSKQSQFSDF